MKFVLLFRNHRWVFVLALLTSVIMAFPQVYFRIDHRGDGIYQGIELLPDSPRSALAREVLDGHPGMGNVYYKDGKDGPYLWQPLQPMVVGYMGKLFNLDINNTLLLSRVVLSFATVLLIYAFVFLLSSDKLLALSGAALIPLGDQITTFAGLSRLFSSLGPANFLQLSRPVNPAMTYIPFFAFLVVFWLFYQKRDWRYGIASAVLLGLNFYNYFYTWTFLYGFGGVLILIFLLQKRWQEGAKFASVFFGGLLVAIPYFVNLYQASLHPNFIEASARFGVVLSRAPIFVGLSTIVALSFFLLGFPRADKEKFFFCLALLLAAFVTHNQQILTGRIMQVDHYHWFFNKPLALIMVLFVVFYFLTSRGLLFYKKSLAVAVILVSIFTGLFTQIISYFSDWRDGGMIAIERQKYGPVMRWLSEHAPKEAVVLANNEVSHLTVIYTPLNVFYHRVAGNSLAATKARLLDVVSTFYRLRGIDREIARETFFAERHYLSTNLYGIYYREVFGSYEAIPDEKIEEALAFYQNTLTIPRAEWLERIFTKYEIEYLVWDKSADPTWNVDHYQFLEKSAVFGDVTIYRKI